jgi:hypothetical protein
MVVGRGLLNGVLESFTLGWIPGVLLVSLLSSTVMRYRVFLWESVSLLEVLAAATGAAG